MPNPHNLEVFQEAKALSKSVYLQFKNLKDFWLRDQMFRSFTSVAANLAELGSFDWEQKKQIKQKIRTCIGECNESEYWLEFCKDVGLMESEEKYKEFQNSVKTIRMKLYNLLESFKDPKI